jgi:putative endonuclease
MYHVYILTNRRNGTLCVGCTSDLVKRIYQHKQGCIKGFTEKYKVNVLVHCEMFYDVNDAISRERNLKSWRRIWKLRLIEEKNPEWSDLYEKMMG